MKYRNSDILLNIFLPLFLGVWTYFISSVGWVPEPIRNHLADGLWAYAFMNSILIIWERRINKVWVSILFIISVSFELLQYNQFVTGTGDMYDVVTYAAFFTIALILNKYFKLQYQF